MWTAVSIADATVVNPNGIKTLLANGLNAFLIKGNPVFSNGPKSLLEILLVVLFFCEWAVENFTLADEPFAKALQSFESCALYKLLCMNHSHH